ncbi:hypothetical protein [Phenylobacterium sp.]|uniref:hypothetical protein n=1 Tax=Phenylobacterium sp. TaxID=1871053 RepID=UPI001203D6CF|nr:hypothetical protein [Phenylobacterium sp.]THD60988.1 MAG: hypothetical protein E8A49_12005 [Phenylobacterium sp.]
MTLQIGAPYHCNTGEWACPVDLSLYEGLSDIRGEDSYQALCLAIRFAQNLLQGFVDDGGKLLVGGEPFPIEAYGFKSPPISPR